MQDGGHPARDGPDSTPRGHGDPQGRRRGSAQGSDDGEGDAVENVDGQPRGQPAHPGEGVVRREAVLDRRRRGVRGREEGQFFRRQGFRRIKGEVQQD